MTGNKSDELHSSSPKHSAYFESAPFVAERIRDAHSRICRVDISRAKGQAAQCALGWLNAMFAQAHLIVQMISTDHHAAVAPNVRLFYELFMRLRQLAVEGDTVVESLTSEAKYLTNKFKESLADLEIQFDRADWKDLEGLDVRTVSLPGTPIRGLVDRLPETRTLYVGWWSETQICHASLELGISNAPFRNGKLGFSQDFVHDHNPEHLWALLHDAVLAVGQSLGSHLENEKLRIEVLRAFLGV